MLADVESVIDREFGNGITPLIRRAFFTIGDGNFFTYWHSWFYAKDLPKFCLIYDDREFRSFTEPNNTSREALKFFVLAIISRWMSGARSFTPSPESDRTTTPQHENIWR